MQEIEDILSPIQHQMDRLDEVIFENLKSPVPLLEEAGQYIIRSGGKKLRPALLFLAAGMCGKGDPEKLCQAASAIEYIHTATLLHDDVLDGAQLRRHKKTVNFIWGNEAAVLVGDYLFSSALNTLSKFGDITIPETISNTTTLMAEGEILQLTRSYETGDEADYMKIISLKTANLIGAAMKIGGILGGGSQKMQNALYEYGMQVGIAFQIIDDVLDCSSKYLDTGKKKGVDIKERKITLPLIYLLNNSPLVEQEKVRSILRQNIVSDQDVILIFELMEQFEILSLCIQQAEHFLSEAKKNLIFFPNNQFSHSLELVTDYITRRDK